MVDDVLICDYITGVLMRDELQSEIDRIQRVLIRIHKKPLETREAQQIAVDNASKLFKALLAAKPQNRRENSQ